MCDIDFAEVFSRLKADPDSTLWTERAKLAQHLGDAFASGDPGRAGRALACILAQDSKWEVRAEAAEMLLYLPEADYQELAPHLANDHNEFVCQSARHAIDRRRRAAKKTGQTRQAAASILKELKAIEAKFGPVAAKMALRLCERHSEVIVGSMVHDLRSLLTLINADSLTLTEHFGRRRRVSTRLLNALNLEEQTLNDMQTYTQTLPPQRRREWLVDIVGAALKMAETNVREQRFDPDVITIDVRVAESIVVEVARHLIVMALSNVLANALEAFADGGQLRPGTIDLHADVSGGNVEIIVRDDAKGIPEQALIHHSLFLPGRRNKTKKRGTGYGLPIATRYLAAHGGTLTLASVQGKGTIVTIVLPMTATEERLCNEATSVGCGR